ncbi:helix-turn-helix domain-containing protein [Alloprevotella tannerae]|nr:helix-turn-helix domain-containing protein [Alloprevotella tannerae]
MFVLLKKKMPVKSIADTINVHNSTVYRELKRNKGRNHPSRRS